MPTIKLKDVEKWIVTAEKVFGNPAARSVLKAILPQLGLTKDQMADLDIRHAGYQDRKALAQQRAGR